MGNQTPKILQKRFKVAVIGHRGFKKAFPENTLLSFEQAIAAGADSVELDVHFTKDKQIVVCHDGSTKRTANAEYIIAETDFATLRTLDMGQGQKIPLLSEVFAVCKGKVGVHIEIKVHGMAESLVKFIKEHGMGDQVAFSSFKHSELAAIKKIAPDLLCSVLVPTVGFKAIIATVNPSVFIKEAQKVAANGIHPFTKFIKIGFCEKAHAAGYYVNPWTIDSPTEWQRLIDAGVDGIITNDPKGLVEFLSK